MSKFQLIILGIFIVFIISGVVAFATFRGGGSESELPPIAIWGTFPADVFENHLRRINNSMPERINVSYVQKAPDQFSRDFIAALARGQGPDAILIPSDAILPHLDKIIAVPYEAYPQREYLDTYVQAADVYLGQDGLLALPLTIDPLVMYWNRDIHDTSGIATYPRYWEDFSILNQRITLKDQNGNIRRSSVALGEFVNITNAREILGSLILQTGNPITHYGQDGLESSLNDFSTADISSAVGFYSKTVNSADPNYSWNRSLPESKTAFLSGLLSTYFGFASELQDIRVKNPNLNFDVAPLPQFRSGRAVSYGRLYGLSIVRTTPYPNSAFQIMSILSSPTFLKQLSDSLYTPSVRRDVIANGSNDPYLTIFNQAALTSRTWIDADPAQSRALFRSMIESITSGTKTTQEAIDDAGDQYDILLRQAVQ